MKNKLKELNKKKDWSKPEYNILQIKNTYLMEGSTDDYMGGFES